MTISHIVFSIIIQIIFWTLIYLAFKEVIFPFLNETEEEGIGRKSVDSKYIYGPMFWGIIGGKR